MGSIVVLFGADVGDVQETCTRVERLLAERLGKVMARSRDHWTPAWGFEGHDLFLNVAFLVAVGEQDPQAVMHLLLDMETELGRVRPAHGGLASRTVDLDILYWDERRIDLPGIHVPHPRVAERRFALGPAADIVPGLVDPVLGVTVLQLLDRLGV